MFKHLYSRLLGTVLMLSATLVVGEVAAQPGFPTHPIKMVVGSEAGSAPDILARAVAQEMGAVLGQSIFIDNKPGAAGTIGASSVVGAPADGYTLLMGTVSNISLAPSFYNIKYEPSSSFTPIGMVASVPLVLVTNPGFDVQTLAQLRERAKQDHRLNYASPGVGGPQHLAGVLLQKELGAQFLHVPYKSGGAAMTAVVSGEVQFAFAGIPPAIGLIKSKKATPILITSSKRSSVLGDIPSANEVGVPDLQIDNWHALLAPANLPENVRSTLEDALQKALTLASVKVQFQKVGAEPAPSTSKQLGAFIATETQRWAKVVVDQKLKSE